MMDSVSTPYDQCIDLLVKNIKLDPYFNDFFQWSLKNNMPVVVLSSGMTPVIRAILANLVGPDSDKIDIISNDRKARPGKDVNEENGWELVFHDDRYNTGQSAIEKERMC
jgi:2-hydroxy-3-keto-5-methylthiopentenyl-1-phosphate phosphatase